MGLITQKAGEFPAKKDATGAPIRRLPGYIKCSPDLFGSAKVSAIAKAIATNRKAGVLLTETGESLGSQLTAPAIDLLVIAALLKVWSAASAIPQPADCDHWYLPGQTLQHIDNISGLPGLGQAMVAEGWITVVEDGLEFTNYARYNWLSKTPEAVRKQRQREKLKQASVTCPVTSHAENVTESVTCPVTKGPENVTCPDKIGTSLIGKKKEKKEEKQQTGTQPEKAPTASPVVVVEGEISRKPVGTQGSGKPSSQAPEKAALRAAATPSSAAPLPAEMPEWEKSDYLHFVQAVANRREAIGAPVLHADHAGTVALFSSLRGGLCDYFRTTADGADIPAADIARKAPVPALIDHFFSVLAASRSGAIANSFYASRPFRQVLRSHEVVANAMCEPLA